jgi:hypothetical protein
VTKPSYLRLILILLLPRAIDQLPISLQRKDPRAVPTWARAVHGCSAPVVFSFVPQEIMRARVGWSLS